RPGGGRRVRDGAHVSPACTHCARLCSMACARCRLGLRSGGAPDRFLVAPAALSLLAEAAEAQPLVYLVEDALWLATRGIPVALIELPRPQGVERDDVGVRQHGGGHAASLLRGGHGLVRASPASGP